MMYGGLAVCDVWGVWKKFGFDCSLIFSAPAAGHFMYSQYFSLVALEALRCLCILEGWCLCA